MKQNYPLERKKGTILNYTASTRRLNVMKQNYPLERKKGTILNYTASTQYTYLYQPDDLVTYSAPISPSQLTTLALVRVVATLTVALYS
jgi:hypothetical protein